MSKDVTYFVTGRLYSWRHDYTINSSLSLFHNVYFTNTSWQEGVRGYKEHNYHWPAVFFFLKAFTSQISLKISCSWRHEHSILEQLFVFLTTFTSQIRHEKKVIVTFRYISSYSHVNVRLKKYKRTITWTPSLVWKQQIVLVLQ